jgi:hypothetical protein
MQLKPLYQLRYRYTNEWEVALTGSAGREEEHFFFAEGATKGKVAGRFRGANHPHRRTDLTYVPDLQGVIETEDGAVILVDWHGYGRAYPKGRRQIVGAAFHVTDNERYKWLNDSVCVTSGEVRSPDVPPEEYQLSAIEIVIDVSELIWEAPKD